MSQKQSTARKQSSRQASRVAIVVLGMHRTGTSAMSRVLHRCGAALPTEVMPPQPDNPTGFWESPRLADLADEILAQSGLTWDSVGRIPDAWFESPAAAEYAQRYADLFALEFPGEGPWLLKDPRLCRLVPLLRQALASIDVEPRFVMTLRHPLEVARSLQARNGHDLERGQALWLEHCLVAESRTRGLPRTLVRYSDILGDWRGVVNRINDSLGLVLDYNDGKITAELDATIDPDLRHHDAALDEEDTATMSPVVDSVYQALLKLDAGKATATRVLDRLQDQLGASESLFATLADKESQRARSAEVQRDLLHRQHTEAVEALRKLETRLSAERRKFRRDLEEREQAAARANSEREQAVGEARVQRQRIRDAEAALEDLRRRHDQAQAQLRDIESRLSASELASKQARAELESAQRDSEARARDLARQQRRVESLEARLKTAEQERKQAREHHRKLQADLKRLEGSYQDKSRELSEAEKQAAHLQGQLEAAELACKQERERVRQARAELAEQQVLARARAGEQGEKRGVTRARELVRAEQRVARLESRLEAAEKARKQEAGKLRKAHAEVTSLDRDKRDLGKRLARAERSLSRLEARLEAEKTAKKQERERIRELRGELNDYRKAAREQARELARSEREVAKLEARLATATRRQKENSARLRAETARSARLQKRIDAMQDDRSSHDAMISEVAELRSDLQTRYERENRERARNALLAEKIEELSEVSSHRERLLREEYDNLAEAYELNRRRYEEKLEETARAAAHDRQAYEGMLQKVEHEAALAAENEREAYEDKIRRLEHEAAGYQGEAVTLQSRLRERERMLAEAYASHSWRLTWPLRAAGTLFRGTGTLLARLRTRLHWLVLRYVPLPSGLRTRLKRSYQRRPDVTAEHRQHAAELLPLEITGSPDMKQALRAWYDKQLAGFLGSGEKMVFTPPLARPRISIVLVLYNQAPLTFACLKSLQNSAFQDFELIIVDNKSRDDTEKLLDRLRNCRIIRNQENVHFLRGVNQAAEYARGKYLLLLNNDAQLHPDTLDMALAVFEQESNAGAVGGRIIRPDGTLQEAGSIVWSDGSCLGYGRDEDPDSPEFMFRRDVDYCSGAFLLTPRSLFEEVGRFDEQFAPAYYEESDYCTQLWEMGYRVIYEPSVRILHYEFASSSHEAAASLSERNQARFFTKHRDKLAQHLDPVPENILIARSARREATRVLLIDDRFPHCNLGSGFPRANRLLRHMVEAGLEVTLFATDQAMVDRWDEVYTDIPDRVECLRGDREQDLANLLGGRQHHYDVLFVSRPHNMEAVNRVMDINPLILDGKRVVYDAEALFTLRDVALRELEGETVPQDEIDAALREEVALCQHADTVITVSEAEAEHYRRLSDKQIHVVGHVLEPCPGPASFEQRSDFLFVGAFHDDDNPNAESMLWFVDKVWPLIRDDQRTREAELHIVGWNKSERVQSLDSYNGVNVVGAVEETGPWYNRARVGLVPTRYAAGIPYKAHECAAHGLPMVMTDLIARQLGWKHEQDGLISNRFSAREFAGHCVRLYVDASLWQQVQASALARINSECSASVVNATLLEVFSPGARENGEPRAPADDNHAVVEQHASP